METNFSGWGTGPQRQQGAGGQGTETSHDPACPRARLKPPVWLTEGTLLLGLSEVPTSDPAEEGRMDRAAETRSLHGSQHLHPQSLDSRSSSSSSGAGEALLLTSGPGTNTSPQGRLCCGCRAWPTRFNCRIWSLNPVERLTHCSPTPAPNLLSPHYPSKYPIPALLSNSRMLQQEVSS